MQKHDQMYTNMYLPIVVMCRDIYAFAVTQENDRRSV